MTPVWFITGCSTGLGRALATAVLERGLRAVVTARKQAERAAEQAEAAFGRIDVLVNNARRSGHVVSVSSLGGLAAFGATGYHHATKFAVEGLSESLAAEVGPLGIGVTIVEPAAFRTNWSGPSMRRSRTVIDDYPA
ncbi:NAD(P)-dependent dehydrogenase (short-subunit alcohol dehydrogenase family) [Nonomuraea thailandensis]|uniref:NAD(P)-dependent dehydrogenase (Short-subunit alcohol dehydrogenase family) n=1 Tax=Nonomuraea thailandensis TaxID=1188745 RepID=A0A9X2K510_9ACTN|nr:SDR family NAD(P)-dependent oxidoreductase [Nonomuraea thailandensis]MCP2360593.1 NAD(P)-dependent dehydrogenase (short-subunit alcohol dehydrogenase family) [Nonomuraea thailandensis]